MLDGIEQVGDGRRLGEYAVEVHLRLLLEHGLLAEVNVGAHAVLFSHLAPVEHSQLLEPKDQVDAIVRSTRNLHTHITSRA